MIKKYLSAALVILVGFSSFLGFKPFFEGITDNVAQQFISATFGSIFASILTMFLLNQQTEIEEREHKRIKKYSMKRLLYLKKLSMRLTIYLKTKKLRVKNYQSLNSF
jgi:hypothetical protein